MFLVSNFYDALYFPALFSVRNRWEKRAGNVKMFKRQLFLSCEQFLQQIEFSRTFLRAKQVGKKGGTVQFVVEIAHKAVVLILISL